MKFNKKRMGIAMSMLMAVTVMTGIQNTSYSDAAQTNSTATVKATAKSINSKSINVSSISNKGYTGKVIKPKVTIKDGKKQLVQDKDYKLSYSNNKEVGTATVTIKGIGKYSGTKKVNFKILLNKVSNISQTSRTTNKIELTWDKVVGANGYRVYSSTSKDGEYESVGVVKGKNTYMNTDLSSGKIYYYKVRAYRKVGDKNVYSSYSAPFIASTKCAAPTVKVSTTNNTVKVSWNKVSGASGYRVYKSISKDGKYEAIKTITSGKTISYTDKDVKAGKTYYYKVIAYKNVDGKKVYGSYSSIKSVKINNTTSSDSFLNFQKEVVRLVKVERAKVGLKELSFNIQLCDVATLKSQDMIDKNYFDHTSPTYGSPFDMMKKFNISYKAAGENIAMGQRTPAEVVEAWMNSKGHRENILNSKFTDLGVGIAKKSDGTLYWTQMFIGK